MRLDDVRAGQRVIIQADDSFYAYVDTWTGFVRGINNGLVQLDCLNPDGQPVQLFVPPAEIGLLH